MPGFDQSGPFGEGPLTGRRRGICAGNEHASSGYGNWFRGGFRRGPFRGRGRGYGFRGGFGYPDNAVPQSKPDKNYIENEINFLKEQISFLEKQLSNQGEKE